MSLVFKTFRALLVAIPARRWGVIEVNSVAPANVVPHDRADEFQVAHPRPEPVEVDGLVSLSSGHLINFLRLTFHN